MREAIVLAGGLGTRLKAVTGDIPKPMAPILGRPFLELLLSHLCQQGFDRAVLALGYKAEQIIKHFGGKFSGMEIDHVVEPFPLGTGGGVRMALDRVHSNNFFVLNGDTYLGLDFAALERVFPTGPVLVARRVSDSTRYGGLVVSDGCVRGFLEKGLSGPGLINAGCYRLQRQQLAMYKCGENFSLERDYLPGALALAPFGAFICEGLFIDIGIPLDYFRAQSLLSNFVE
jgi:D-glycero-alpha-D-manno-heptose 1-phosphate guanylyltransferase